MELDSGVCGICDSKNEIIYPKDAGAFWETICGIFKDQFDKKLIEQSQLKICLPCIFHANLINTKKHILKKIISNIDSAVNNKCKFCKTKSNLLKVQNSAVFKYSKSCQPSKGCSVICACCYYVIKANYVLKTNLLNNLSDCSTSTLKDSLHSIKTERCSDDDSSTFTKSKKNVVDGSKEGVGEIFIHSDILIEKNISDADMKLPNEPNCRKKRNKRSKEKVEDAKLLSITTENKKTRKRKFSSLSNKDSSQQLKKACMQINKVNDLDMSKVICLMPLCKTTVVVNEAIKQDAKFYNSVPYVQVPIIIKTEKHSSESPEHVTKKKSEQMLKAKPVSPIGIIKRTPPIKIKLKKITKLKKGIMEKKQNTKNLTQDKPSTNTIMFDEFKRKEVVVKVERMILPKDQKEPEPQLENTELETSVVAYESVLKNSSIREETPKKKKKVHFNDTPTIIITADELSEDSTNEEEDISTKKIIKNGKILKFEEEPTEEEYSFKINSDDSKDEIPLKIQDDPTGGKIKISVKEETKISPDKENDTTEIMDIDGSESESEELGDIGEGNKSKSVEGVMQKPQNEEENIELTAIDISSEEPEQLPSSPSQLNDQGDSITPCKESGDETIELENSIISEECQSNVGEVNVIVKNIQAKEKNLNQEDSSVEESMEIQEKGSEIEDKNENEEKISIKKISTVGKSSLEETEFTVIEDSDDEIQEEGSEIEDKNENEEKISIKKISTVGKSSLEETESTVIEDSDDEIQEEGSEIEDKNENEEKISIKKISTVGKSSLEETEFTVIEDSDNEIPDEITSVQVTSEKKAESELENTEKVSETANIEEIESTENILETDNVEEVEKKQDNELDAAKIVVNDVVLSEATTASEDFGSLIDEVQKCLTNKDEVSEDVLEMNDSNDETEKDDNLLSCLNDLD